MKEFSRLLDIAAQLLAPGGCSWDREQTLLTLQPYLIEETHELLEAIDLGDGEKMAEELGDVLYNLVFIAKLGESQKLFTMKQAIESECEKLIRRHPHVFGDVKVSSNEEIIRNWNEIKKKEKGASKSDHPFAGIPPSLPALPKAQKMAHRVRKLKGEKQGEGSIRDEAHLGDLLWDLVVQAEKQGIDAESALRRRLQAMEKKGPEIGPRHEGHL